MAIVTTSPATLQPCKHATRGVVVRRCSPPLQWRSRHHGQVLTTTKAAAARGGPVSAPAVGVVSVADEEGDMVRRLKNGPDVRGVALEGEPGRAGPGRGPLAAGGGGDRRELRGVAA
jgi:hypothetical protein